MTDMTEIKNSDYIAHAKEIPGLFKNGQDLMEQLLSDASELQISSPQTQDRDTTNIQSRETISSSLFALIIGIDTYNFEGFWNLRGAQADAQRFKAYLTQELSVPESHVELLLDTDATRQAIISAFEKIANDNRIARGDPIVIFYAGHGSEKDHLFGGAKCKVQMLVPVDRLGIPDFIIGMLIDHISQKKGDNITVIFDCCNSASGTRGVIDNRNSTSRTRAIPPDLVTYNAALDHDLCERIGGNQDNITRNFRSAGLKSHILLAACRSSEEAKEIGDHGVFTSALLKLFDVKPPTVLRYCDILLQMEKISSGQNPQCEGYHQTRKVFDGKVVTRSKQRFDIVFQNPEDRTLETSTTMLLTLHGGSAHGITKGAKFNLHNIDDASFTTVLGEATVGPSIEAFRSTATLGASSTLDLFSPHFDVTRRYVAVLTTTEDKEDLRLYTPPEDKFYNKYKRLCQSDSAVHVNNIKIVDRKGTSHLQASMDDDDMVTFELTDARATMHKFSKRFMAVPTDDDRKLAWVLNRIAHFYGELDRQNPKGELASQVSLEFYKLVTESEAGNSNWRMSKREHNGPNFCHENIIDFVIEDAPYGFKLSNNSQHDLYPYVFLFDNSDLSIESYYTAPALESNYQIDSPLKKAGGFLTLGHGSAGAEPREFYMQEDQTIDLSFVKIYLTTKPVTFDNVSQKCPFDIEGRSSRPYSGVSNTVIEEDKWDVLTIPMIQRRGA